MTDELYHHGIKGMKWGVRRYQNPDGSLTEKGLKRQRLRRRVHENIKTTDDANKIVSRMSEKDRNLLAGQDMAPDELWIDKTNEYDISANLAKRIILKDGDIPMSMFEIWDNTSDKGHIAIATDPAYRGQGNALKAAQEGLEWYKKYGKKNIENLYWVADKTNTGSITLAKKLNFEEYNPKEKQDRYIYFRYRQ